MDIGRLFLQYLKPTKVWYFVLNAKSTSIISIVYVYVNKQYCLLLITSISLNLRIQIETRKKALKLLGNGIQFIEMLGFKCTGKRHGKVKPLEAQ